MAARLIAKGVKPGLKESVKTFMVSAIWHGFYPYYYYMFFLCGVVVELAKDIYRARILFEFIPASMRHFVGNIVTLIFLNYLGTSFGLLSFEKGGNLAKGTNYIIMVLMIGSLVMSKSLGMVGYA